jgi:uncharacterized protein
MTAVPAQIKEFILTARDPLTIFVGTVDSHGVPNISAKGTFINFFDDETLVYADVYSLKTLDNVKHNPNVAIAVINAKAYKGYQFKGIGEIVDKGPLLNEAQKHNPQIKTVTKVKIEKIYWMDYGPQAGKEIG